MKEISTKDFAKSLGMTTTKAVLVDERYRKSLEKKGLRYTDGVAYTPDLIKIEFVTTQPSKQCRECGGVKPDHFESKGKKCYLIKS